MTDKPIEIINCHVHLFTQHHTPEHYPFWGVGVFNTFPFLVTPLAWTLGFFNADTLSEKLYRLRNFHAETRQPKQKNILENIARHYPDRTRFVVLPMDLTQIGHGRVPVSLTKQHNELAELASDPVHGPKVIPFATIDPRTKYGVEELWRAIDELGFKGIKLYPRLGFPPDHPVLMEHVYPRAEAEGLPIMSHCSRGGVQGKTRYDPAEPGKPKPLNAFWADRYTEPHAFDPVLKAFPDLKVCLAHFGGSRDWKAYVNPDKDATEGDEYNPERNWFNQIRWMIESGDYPNLYTDISYTLFDFEENIPFLRHFLTSEGEGADRLRAHVLFGSDYYMTRQEVLSERAVCFRLRTELGEEIFRQIAETNPLRWLTGRPG